MKPHPITLFSASAGSGKTYTLTIEYIKMALSEVENKGYFRRILAVTFTIKAAEEMRQRILQFLSGISDFPKFHNTSLEDQPKVLAIMEKIHLELKEDGIPIEKEELAFRASNTLQQILQDYGLFSVMTIDSFVQRLSASFIDELNLPSQYEVLLDSNNLIHELINRLLDQVNKDGDSQLSDLILAFANQEVTEGRNWNRMRDSLHAFLKITLDESFLAVDPHISKFQISEFIQLEEQLRKVLSTMIFEIREVANNFNQVIQAIGLEDFCYFQGGRGPVGTMRSAVDDSDVFEKPYAYLRTAIDKNSWVSGKASATEKSQIEQYSSELSELGSHFIELQELYSKRFYFIQWVLKDLKKIALLNVIQQEMRFFQQENSAIPISEFAKRVYQVISSDPIPFIYEKLGDRYFHIFIDEFQDTSILQWKNFMPLIENTTSLGKRSLLVGDAKQSIYKFRGGEVSLIASLSNQDYSLVSSYFGDDSLDEQRFYYLLQQVNPKALDDNYRSAKEIVTFNNGFYQSLTENEKVRDLCSLISPLYGKNLLQNPKISSSDFSGKVDLITYKKTDENFGFLEPENEFMFEQVLHLIHHNLALGFKYQDVAILTRKNKHSRYLALRLKEKGIPIVSSDSLLVHYSPFVGLLISFLSLHENRDDSLFLYEVVYQFAEIRGVKVTTEELEVLAVNSNLDCFEKACEYFLTIGYRIPEFSDLLKWVYDLVSVFDLLNHSHGQEYLWKFLDILNEYVILKDKSVQNFLQHFNQNKNGYCISSSSAENAVTISSIHKSKGLEYPVVIIPFVNWTFTPDSEMIWYDLNELSFADLKMENGLALNYTYGRVNASEPAGFPTLISQIAKEKEAIFLDALNMLYVATTRPKQSLHLLVSVPEEEKVDKRFDNSVGKLVFDYAKGVCEKQDLPLFLQSETPWNSNYYSFDSTLLVPKNVFKDTVNIPKNIRIRLKNNHTSIQLRLNTTQADLYTSASKKREIGNQLHAILSELTDVKDWVNIRSKTSVDVSKIDELLSINEIQSFFDADKLAFKEIDLLCPDGSIVRPDRVNNVGDALQVIDFKTGKPKSEHHDQINRYKNTLQDMGYKVTKGVLIYIDSKELVYV